MPDKEEKAGFQAYHRALNRQFKQGAEEAKGFLADQQNGISFTVNQKYFIGQFEAAIQHTYYLNKDIEDENILWQVGIGIAATVAAQQTSRLLCSLIPKKEIGDVISHAVTGLTALYAVKTLGDKAQAKKQASRFVRFLGNSATHGESKESKDPSLSTQFITDLACEFYLEYRSAIEMLAKSKKGLDRLIKFFITRVQEIIAHMSDSQLSGMSETDKLDYLKRQITSGKIPKEDLLLRGCEDGDTFWNLQGLLTRAPIIIWSQQEQQKSFKSVVYVCSDDTKNKTFLWVDYSSSTNADCSYKYPCTIKFTDGAAVMAPGYKSQHERCFVIPDNTWGKPTGEYSKQIEQHYDNLVVLYKNLRNSAKSKSNMDLFAQALDSFCLVHEQLVARKCCSNLEWQHKFTEMEQLRNIFLSVLQPIYDANIGKLKKATLDKWATCEHCAHFLTHQYTDKQREKLNEEAQARVHVYFNSRVDQVKMAWFTKASYQQEQKDFEQMEDPEVQLEYFARQIKRLLP